MSDKISPILVSVEEVGRGKDEYSGGLVYRYDVVYEYKGWQVTKRYVNPQRHSDPKQYHLDTYDTSMEVAARHVTLEDIDTSLVEELLGDDLDQFVEDWKTE